MTKPTSEEIIDQTISEIWSDPQVKSSMVNTRQALVQALTDAGKVIVDREQMADALYEAIKHGDTEHRAWLREACANFFAGKPVPLPRAQ